MCGSYGYVGSRGGGRGQGREEVVRKAPGKGCGGGEGREGREEEERREGGRGVRLKMVTFH